MMAHAISLSYALNKRYETGKEACLTLSTCTQ